MRKSEDSTHSAAPRLATVTQLAKMLNGALTEAAIRSQVWAAEPHTLRNGRAIPANGLAPAVIRVGRKVLIDVDCYFTWLEARRLAPLYELSHVAQSIEAA